MDIWEIEPKPKPNKEKALVDTLQHFVWLFNNVIDDYLNKGELRDRIIEQCEKAQRLIDEK